MLFCLLTRKLLTRENYNSGSEQEEVEIQACLFCGEGLHIALSTPIKQVQQDLTQYVHPVPNLLRLCSSVHRMVPC